MTIKNKFKIGDEVYYFNDSYFIIEHNQISKIEILFDGIETIIKYHFKDCNFDVLEEECFNTLDECTDNIKLNLLTNCKYYSTRKKDHI